MIPIQSRVYSFHFMFLYVLNIHCCDFEGHLGKDGRYYLLDLARSLPPESPAICTHLPHHPQAIFFRLFRPELMVLLKASGKSPPLSPDALSGWGAQPPDEAHKLNLHVHQATQHLCSVIIPDFAHELDKMDNKRLALFATNISVEVHRRGINCRHLGLLWSHCQSSTVRALLLVNMVYHTNQFVYSMPARNSLFIFLLPFNRSHVH
jgi:hypothetical protein